MRIVKWYTNWDNGSEFSVELFEEMADAQKYLNEQFVKIVKERDDFDEEDVDEIMLQLKETRRVEIDQERYGCNTDVRYEWSQWFEFICDDSWTKVFYELEEISFNTLYK